MENISCNTGQARTARYQGRDYWVAPMTLIVPGVLAGSKGALYYPPDEVRRSTETWNDVPITVYHPTDPLRGTPLSASSPKVTKIGFLRNTRFDGKLRCEGWFDKELTIATDKRVANALEVGAKMELSTGLFTDDFNAPGTHNGRAYEYVAKNYRPDHLAILPDQQGACSLYDGCGVHVTNRDWPQDKRDRTPGKDFGGPHQSFPVVTQEDLDNAARLIGHANDPEAVKAKLIRIAKRKGLTLPTSWVTNAWSDAARAASLAARKAAGSSSSRSADAEAASGKAQEATSKAEKSGTWQDHYAAHQAHYAAAVKHADAAGMGGASTEDADAHRDAAYAHTKASNQHGRFGNKLRSSGKGDPSNNMTPTVNVWSDAAREASAEARRKSSTAAIRTAQLANHHADKIALEHADKPSMAAAKQSRIADKIASAEVQRGSSKAAADAHSKAADLHEQAADFHAAGKGELHMKAERTHRDAADLHREAAGMYAARNCAENVKEIPRDDWNGVVYNASDDTGDDDMDDDMDDDTPPTGNRHRRPTAPAPKAKCAEAWLKDAPPEVQSVVRNALQQQKHEHQSLVNNLVQHVESSRRKQDLTEVLNKMPVEHLRLFQHLVPRAAPVYAGGVGGAFDVTDNSDADGDVLSDPPPLVETK